MAGAYSSPYDFSDGIDGVYPISPVTIAAGGTFYGTTGSGGGSTCGGECGVVWMIKP